MDASSADGAVKHATVDHGARAEIKQRDHDACSRHAATFEVAVNQKETLR